MISIKHPNADFFHRIFVLAESFLCTTLTFEFGPTQLRLRFTNDYQVAQLIIHKIAFEKYLFKVDEKFPSVTTSSQLPRSNNKNKKNHHTLDDNQKNEDDSQNSSSLISVTFLLDELKKCYKSFTKGRSFTLDYNKNLSYIIAGVSFAKNNGVLNYKFQLMNPDKTAVSFEIPNQQPEWYVAVNYIDLRRSCRSFLSLKLETIGFNFTKEQFSIHTKSMEISACETEKFPNFQKSTSALKNLWKTLEKLPDDFLKLILENKNNKKKDQKKAKTKVTRKRKKSNSSSSSSSSRKRIRSSSSGDKTTKNDVDDDTDDESNDARNSETQSTKKKSDDTKIQTKKSTSFGYFAPTFKCWQNEFNLKAIDRVLYIPDLEKFAPIMFISNYSRNEDDETVLIFKYPLIFSGKQSGELTFISSPISINDKNPLLYDLEKHI